MSLFSAADSVLLASTATLYTIALMFYLAAVDVGAASAAVLFPCALSAAVG